MLTELQKLVFRLHVRLFFYMYPIPVFWDEGFNHLKLSKSILIWIPWVIALTSVTIFGVASLGAPIYAHFTPNLRLNAIHSTISTLVGVAAIVLIVITVDTCMNIRTIISALNEEFWICEKLNREYPRRRQTSAIWRKQLRDRLKDKYGLVLFIVVASGGIAPFAAVFAALYTSYDVTYVIMEKFLTNPMYREIDEIFLAMGIRSLIIFFLTTEVARTVTFFSCCVLCAIDHAAKIIEILRKRVVKFRKFLDIYTQMRILFSKVKEWVTLVIYLVVGTLFWTTVGCCWTCVKCYGKIPWPIYAASVVGSFLLIFGHILVLPPSVKAAEMCMEVVKFHYKRAKLIYVLATWKMKLDRIILKQGFAVAPIKFKYGSFWVIGKRFAVEYFCLLMWRMFDAILIIDF